jgi:type I restriction enzyme S subunit
MKKGWEIKTLGEVCDKASSNIAQNKLNDNEGIYPIYGASGFIKNIDFYQQENEYIAIVKDGSGVGRVTLYPEKSSVLGTLQYIIPNEKVTTRYIYYFLNSIDFDKYKCGAAIHHIYFNVYSN